MSQNYYEILGVDRGADETSIKKAYRQMAMKYHPDKNPGNKEAEDKFKEAARAYEVLSNPEKRSRYDRFGEAGVNGPGGGAGFGDVDDIFSAFGDIFGDFFGGGQRTRGNRARRGSDLKYVVEVDYLEVLKGTEKDISFKINQDCQPCNGSGAEPGSTAETCPTCRGAGQVIRQQGFFQMATTCNQCGGTGQIIRVPCRKCHGKGKSLKEKKLKVNIPAGVDHGNQLRLSGEGETGSLGGGPGDLYVEIHLETNNDFEREGQHLIGKLRISYLHALLGATLEVKTLESPKELEIPAGASSGQLIRLEGEGLPSLRSTRRGDLVYALEIDFPKKLKKEEEKLLRDIAELKEEKGIKPPKKGFF